MIDDLISEWVRLENAFHDSLPNQGESGDPAHGKALCQFLYDNSETIREALILLRDALVNSAFALEFWHREAAVLIPLLTERGLNPAMLVRAQERGQEELATIREALTPTKIEKAEQ